jgi:NAD(P)H-hydrate repair Nnr-like enzyme with NAD(P)H-hydrate dehydratase domain
MQYDFWHKQATDKPLFPDIEWQRPEHKSLAGKLLIIGGNKLGFAAVAQAYNDAKAAGVGECRAIMPEALKPIIDKFAFECVYVPTNPSGGMSKEALPALLAAAAWADALLIIGDAGRNSETAIVLEQLLAKTTKPTIITRDAVDLLRASTSELLQRPETLLVLSLAQLQKLFQAVYYPKTILFSMQLTTLVETLHKFTISYPATIVVFHQNQLLVGHDGQVSSTPWDDTMMIWRGSIATKASVYWLQNLKKPFEAITTSIIRS